MDSYAIRKLSDMIVETLIEPSYPSVMHYRHIFNRQAQEHGVYLLRRFVGGPAEGPMHLNNICKEVDLKLFSM